MSPKVAPGFTAAMPAIMLWWVTSISRCACGLMLPTANMRLESPWKPSFLMVTSMLTISPFFKGLSSGMPWQITWFTEVQHDFG